MDYNLKRDGWLKHFTNVKNQSMRKDGVPWRDVREKRSEFFSIIFLDWNCGVGLFFISLVLMCLFFDILIYFLFVTFHIHFLILTFSHFFVLRGSIITCRSMQRHIVLLESDIDVFKSILLFICEFDQEHTSQQAAPQRGLVFAPPPWKMAKRNFDLLCG